MSIGHPGRGVYAGYPARWSCPKCGAGKQWKDRDGHWRNDPRYEDPAKAPVVRTGREKPAKNIGGRGKLKGWTVSRQVECQMCGHIGWTANPVARHFREDKLAGFW